MGKVLFLVFGAAAAVGAYMYFFRKSDSVRDDIWAMTSGARDGVADLMDRASETVDSAASRAGETYTRAKDALPT